MKTAGHDFFEFMRYVTAKFKQDKCTQMAASLTFDSLLSLVPLITIALTMFSAFPVFSDFSERIKEFLLTNMLPETGGKMISLYVEQFAESASRLTAYGLVFLAVTAMLMLVTINNAFNTIWHVTKPRPWVRRLVVYWAVITLAPLLIGASLSLTSWLVGLSVGYAKDMPLFGSISLKIVPVLLTTLAFSLLIKVVPNCHVPIRHALIGGVVASVAFETMNRVFGYFIVQFPAYKLVYGAFASVPIFLLWIYWSWLTILMGALITASLSRWKHHGLQQLNSTGQFYFAVRIMGLMQDGLVKGEVHTHVTLSRHLHLAFDETEAILEKLRQADLVRRLSGNGWAMIRKPEYVSMRQMADLFLLDASKLPHQVGDEQIHAWFGLVMQRLEYAGSMTLQSLFNVVESDFKSAEK